MMYDPAQRQQLWNDYYRAMQRGDKVVAQQILRLIHNPPSGAQRVDSRPRGGCSRCRRNF
jgi:hypothetical protein